MKDDLKKKYNFEIPELTFTNANENNLPASSNLSNSERSEIEELTNENIPIKDKSSNFSNVIMHKPNTAYLNLVNKSPHQILILKLKCKFKIARLVFQNYYSDDFNQIRSGIYKSVSMVIASQLFFNIYLPFHPLKSSILSIFALAAVGLTFYSWNENIDFIMRQVTTKASTNHPKYLIEISDLLQESLLYNPFSLSSQIKENK